MRSWGAISTKSKAWSRLWVHRRSLSVRFDLSVERRSRRALGSPAISLDAIWVRFDLSVKQRSRRVRSRRALGSGFDLSLGAISLSLCAWVRKWFEVKIFTSNHFRPISLILQSTLKIFSVWPNFPDQPNSLFFGKAFLNLVWSQNKRSLTALY